MNLFLASDPRPVHFVGIAGAGMSPLAMVALKRGVAVTGSDLVPAGAPDLPGLGAVVQQGHDPTYVEGARAVVITAAIRPDHPEVQRAYELGIPVVTRKAALAELVAGALTVGVAGTHGKTTTTVMTTEALAGAGFDPTGLAGGRVRTWGGNARLGSDRLYVVEADEYDQAFLALTPTVAVVTNVEPEHLESYGGSMENLVAAFTTFASPAETVIVGPDAGATQVADRLAGRVWRVEKGTAERFGEAVGGRDDVRLGVGEVSASPRGTRTAIRLPNGGSVMLRLQVPGMHNVLNATSALGVVLALGGDPEPALEALERFEGVGRRFERIGDAAGVTVVDDYAHHPTEISATLTAARQAFPGRRLVAVFQPHLFSRTRAQAGDMGEALGEADLVFVTDVYPAREAPIPGVTGRMVAERVERGGKPPVRYEPDRATLRRSLLAEVRDADVVLTLGAGDITALGPELLEGLTRR